MRGACDKNIEPNLPAPIRPTRTGLPEPARSASFNAKLIARLPFCAESDCSLVAALQGENLARLLGSRRLQA